MQNDKLLPCPFCGGEAEMKHEGFDWFVRCKYCFCKTPMHLQEFFARCIWNQRITMERIVEQLEEVSFERYGNQGMGGEQVVNFDDVVEIIRKGGVDNATN